MPSKYDTNPLDPEFPEKAKAASAASSGYADVDDETETRTLPYRGGETSPFSEPAPTEEQTRRFVDANMAAYSAPYVPPYTGQYVPAQYQQQDLGRMNRSSGRRVRSLGLPENLVIAAAYFPWYIGLVAGLIELLLVPKDEPKVRFHAAQGLAAHLGILAVSLILGLVAGIAGGDLGSTIFGIAAFIMMVVFTIKALRNKPIHVAALDDLTNWLEEKIGPVK